LKIDILTIFPDMFAGIFSASILGRAQKSGIIDVTITDIRPFSQNKHKNTDDYPFGGGAGMLMTPQPIADAIKYVTKPPFTGKRIYMSPRGSPLNQRIVQKLAEEPALVILCGHYEGVDQRIIDRYIDMELSLGDFILTGGEIAAIALADCVSRLIPGVLGSEQSSEDESFSTDNLLEYPQYTRPRVFEGISVPNVLIEGDHAKIAAWRRKQALIHTAKVRPELINKSILSPDEIKLLDPNHPDPEN
jgi:tRNA (guanine37-N1)-methyltransferase